MANWPNAALRPTAIQPDRRRAAPASGTMDWTSARQSANANAK